MLVIVAAVAGAVAVAAPTSEPSGTDTHVVAGSEPNGVVDEALGLPPPQDDATHDLGSHGCCAPNLAELDGWFEARFDAAFEARFDAEFEAALGAELELAFLDRFDAAFEAEFWRVFDQAFADEFQEWFWREFPHAFDDAVVRAGAGGGG